MQPFDGQTGHMEKGMVTTKHAMAFKHTPDYRVEGQDIKVYPGDKVVIKKPSFYIKKLLKFYPCHPIQLLYVMIKRINLVFSL